MVTVAGLIPDDEHVIEAQEALQSTGIRAEDVSVLHQPAEVWQVLDGRRRFRVVIRDAAVGMAIGLGVGLLYGVPAGFLNCRLMDCALGTSLTLLLLISLYWMAAGALIGAVVGLDHLERALYSYVEGVRRGEPLVVVSTSKERVPSVEGILAAEGGSVVHALARSGQ